MTAVNTSLSHDKKNGSIIKKTKHFFSKKKSKHNNNQSLVNNTSLIKEDSNNTLITAPHENNEGDQASLKQNKPEIITKKLNQKEDNVLSKSENLNDNDVNLKTLQDTMDDLDKKINEISNSFKEKSNEWQSNHTEITNHLNCLLWQMNQFKKEQTELSQKLNDELNGVKESVSTENQKLNDELNGVKESVSTETQKLNEEISGVKASISTETQNLNDKINGVKESISTETEKLNEEINGVKESVANEVQKSMDLQSNIDELKLSTEKSDNDTREIKREANETILQQKLELENLNSKLNNLQAEFEAIKEKVEILSSPPVEEEPTLKKIDLNDFDDNVIEYITKCVQEKIEQEYKLKELKASLSRQSTEELINGVDVKMNELNEKVDEFQIYQMSREVELQRMKIKLDDSMVELNKACGKQIKKKKDEKDEMVKKWNMENRKLKEAQYNLKESITELKTIVNDIRKEVFDKLNDQQDKINDINQTTELLQKQSENVAAIIEEKSNEGEEEEEKEVNEAINSSLSEKFDTVQQNIDTLNDELKMLSMETKVMTTNISLIWDDVRSIKNFINQYDMNDKLKEHETNEEISELYGQLNDLKKKINDNL